MSAPAPARAQVVDAGADPLWFLGTLVRMKLHGEQTGGRFALWEGVLPRGAAPPLHSHPQDETIFVLDGLMTAWIVEPELAGEDRGGSPPSWVTTHARECPAGGVLFAPGSIPHTFRVESDTIRALFLSTPAGIEEFVEGLAEPALWPWLQPPPDAPRVAPEQAARVERETGMVRHGPPPPPRDRGARG